MKKILMLVTLALCFAANAGAAELPTTERFDDGQLEKFGCCGLPQ
jgi:hypothetical protein